MFDKWQWALVPIALFYLLCAIVSLISNGIMIIVFFINSKLKLPCNYLITLNCLADIVHQCGHFVFNYQLFTETTLTQAECFYLLAPTVTGYCISGPILLMIGIDRLFACKYPIYYREMLFTPLLYTVCLVLFPIGYVAFLLYFSWDMSDHRTRITCMPNLAMNLTAFRYFAYSFNFIVVGIIIVYAKTYWILRKLNNSDAAHFRNIFKSIFVTVIIVLIGWATFALLNTLSLLLVENPKMIETHTIYSGFAVNIACSSNLFVFYSINSEYRSAIRDLFGMKDVTPIRAQSYQASGTKRAPSLPRVREFSTIGNHI